MDWQGWVNSTALGLLVSVLIEQIQYFQLHILHPLWLVRVLAIHSPYKKGLFHGPVRSKVRSSVARDWEDGKCPLEEDECVSEVLHPLRSSKIHAELIQCGEQFLAARYSRGILLSNYYSICHPGNPLPHPHITTLGSCLALTIITSYMEVQREWNDRSTSWIMIC